MRLSVRSAWAYVPMEFSADELMELSHFGAKVVYPPTVHPARAKGVPLVIKNTGAQDLTAASVLVGPDANSLATLDTATFGTLAAGAVAQLAIAAPIEYLKVIASCAAGTTLRASLALAEPGNE